MFDRLLNSVATLINDNESTVIPKDPIVASLYIEHRLNCAQTCKIFFFLFEIVLFVHEKTDDTSVEHFNDNSHWRALSKCLHSDTIRVSIDRNKVCC